MLKNLSLRRIKVIRIIPNFNAVSTGWGVRNVGQNPLRTKTPQTKPPLTKSPHFFAWVGRTPHPNKRKIFCTHLGLDKHLLLLTTNHEKIIKIMKIHFYET